MLRLLRRSVIYLLILLLVFINIAIIDLVDAQEVKKSDENYNLNLKSLTLKEFVDFVAEFTGKNIVYNEQDLRGNVTISSQQDMSKKAILELFYATLRVNNLYAVDRGEYIQIIKYIDMQDYPDTFAKTVSKDGQDIITTVVVLENVNSTSVATSFNRIKTRTGIVDDIRGINALVVRDTEERVKKMLNIISVLEERGRGMQVYALPVMNTTASNIEAKLTRFYGDLNKQGLTSLTPAIMADDYSNVLIIAATKEDYKRIEYIVSNVDVSGAATRGAPKVYYLKNAQAEDVEEVLNKLLSEVTTEEKIVKYAVAADKPTNSIIAIGDQELYNKVETLVNKLDKTRREVYVEALIVETTVSKTDDFGVEWIAIGESGNTLITGGYTGGNIGSYQGIASGGGGTSGSVGGEGGTSGGGALPGGFSTGVLGDTITYQGQIFRSITALFTALATDSAMNIMSKPQILTLDNEEAEVFVGQNRPFDTGQSVTEGGTSISQTEYRDVGTSLKITPLISSADEITLNIELEVKRVQQVEGLAATTPATITRRTKTRIKMPDDSMMVIGGMISNDSNKRESGIPILKDIPLIGWLFGTSGSSNDKTNLMVFLSAKIIDTRPKIDNITKEKLESNREFKKEYDSF
ncbi:MAG: secretin N-terminal domain-containing protein [Deferribacterota bacterium]|nr:secretin N-terminal domain-containing protein [Deferribacterota bacterium]